MRPVGKIRQKIKQVRFRHLKRWIKDGLRKLPQNCKHNLLYVSSSGKTVGLCKKKAEDWDVQVCDMEMPEGIIQAQSCPYFESCHNVSDLKEEFNSFFSEVGILASKYPDLAALVWVLGEEDLNPSILNFLESPSDMFTEEFEEATEEDIKPVEVEVVVGDKASIGIIEETEDS